MIVLCRRFGLMLLLKELHRASVEASVLRCWPTYWPGVWTQLSGHSLRVTPSEREARAFRVHVSHGGAVRTTLTQWVEWRWGKWEATLSSSLTWHKTFPPTIVFTFKHRSTRHRGCENRRRKANLDLLHQVAPRSYGLSRLLGNKSGCL